MLRRNGPVVKSVESVQRLEGSLWRERFAEEVDNVNMTQHAKDLGQTSFSSKVINQTQTCF